LHVILICRVARVTAAHAAFHRTRLGLVAIAVLVVAGSTVATASGAQFRGTYAVRSIVLTYASNVTTKDARLTDGTTGTLTTTIRATLRSKKPGAATGVRSPSGANEFICSPSCPRFTAGGAITFAQIFTPAGGGTPTSCRSAKTLADATGGTVYVTSSKTGRATLVFRITDTKGLNDLYVALRGTCTLPILTPADSSDYSAFGTRSVATSKLGAKTIVLTFANTLKAPTYPWPATGISKVTANVVLERKS
jgi:hypothetical protein